MKTIVPKSIKDAVTSRSDYLELDLKMKAVWGADWELVTPEELADKNIERVPHVKKCPNGHNIMYIDGHKVEYTLPEPAVNALPGAEVVRFYQDGAFMMDAFVFRQPDESDPIMVMRVFNSIRMF